MILYITSAFPALTVTFIYREVEALRRRGLEIRTVSMNRPAEREISAEARPYLEETLYLDRVGFYAKLYALVRIVLARPARAAQCIWEIMSGRPVKGARDYLRLAYHFIEACYLAREYEQQGLERVHAHFVNGPTSLAMFLGLLCRVPFSFTMHASMIWLDPIALANKLEKAEFCVSISEYNKTYILEQYGPHLDEKIHIVRCGIEPGSMPHAAPSADARPLELLAVGQLNARKGFRYLLLACARLRERGVSLHCTIVGAGEEREALETLHSTLALGHHVSLVGMKTQEQLRAHLESAHIFVLPCVVSKDGWRDGIPVALMEAMAAHIPVVTTNILGLPELVRDDDTGLLVPPEDPDALATAISRLAGDAALRARLGKSGAARVEQEFNVHVSAERLARLFGKAH